MTTTARPRISTLGPASREGPLPRKPMEHRLSCRYCGGFVRREIGRSGSRDVYVVYACQRCGAWSSGFIALEPGEHS